MRSIVLLLPVAMLGACNGAADRPADNVQIEMRNLIDTDEAGQRPAGLAVQGDLIPTPSDTRSTYYLLRTRTPATGPVVSIVRQERGDRLVYARIETDCAARRLLIVGTGNTRGEVETDVATTAALRTIDGLPLRQELATYICTRAGTPLAKS